MSPRIGRFLRLALTVALCAFVLPRIDFEAFSEALAELGLPQLAALCGLVLLQQVLLTKRFAIVLEVLLRTANGPCAPDRMRPPLAGLLLDQQVATAYNVILPSTVGGDVIRGLRARQRLDAVACSSSVVWGAVLLDRFIGLLALVVVPLAGLSAGIGSAQVALLRTAAALTLVLLSLVLFAGRILRALGQFAKRRFKRHAASAIALANVLRAAPIRVHRDAFGYSVLYQLTVNAFFHIASASFGIPLADAIPAIWIGVPMAFVLSTLPVTIGGVGLRESLFVGVLGLYGVSPSQALALSLLWSLQGLTTALAGVIVLWWERPARASPVPPG